MEKKFDNVEQVKDIIFHGLIVKTKNCIRVFNHQLVFICDFNSYKGHRNQLVLL